MSKDLNDALERLARWEELERRRSNTDSPLDEAVVAVKRVVERHPELALTLTVRGPAGTAIVQVDQHDGQVRVIVHRVTQPPDAVAAASVAGSVAPSGPVLGSAPVAGPPSVAGSATGAGSVAGSVAGPTDPRPAVRLAELLREDPYLLSGPPD
jgi:hypothetical protein